jgi:hypothetical protein
MNNLTPQSNLDFSTARQRAFIEEWFSSFTGRPNSLLSFDEVKNKLRLQDSAYKGLQEIELDKIVGSTGRYRDFTRTFLPKNDRSENRWRRVDAVAHSEMGFPPIEVYQVGEVYFVRDGNHRVSVARLHKAKTIEAYVIEYKTAVPIDKQDDLDAILLKMEQTEFFELTQLDKIRPEQTLIFTEPGRYRVALEHITFHKFLKETECGCEIAYEEAVGSWYDSVYAPLIQLIREREVLKNFPNRTEADLYAWLILHRAALEEEFCALGYVSNEDIVEELKQRSSLNPLMRLIRFFHLASRRNMSLRVEHTKFVTETRLDELRPGHGVQFSDAGYYSMVREHIAFHKQLKEMEWKREVFDHEAVMSWYDTDYAPLMQLVRGRGLQKHFPKNTEADIYLWLVLRRADRESKMNALGRIPNEEVVRDLEREGKGGLLTRLARIFANRLRFSFWPRA